MICKFERNTLKLPDENVENWDMQLFLVILFETQTPVLLLLVGARGGVSRLTVDNKMLQNIIMHLLF